MKFFILISVCMKYGKQDVVRAINRSISNKRRSLLHHLNSKGHDRHPQIEADEADNGQLN